MGLNFKGLWNQSHDHDYRCEEVTEAKLQGTLRRIETQRVLAASKSDWILENDLHQAEELIKALWRERKKLRWQVKHGLGMVQTPDKED